jgi:hypothetical protein
MSEEGKKHANELAARLRTLTQERDAALSILRAIVSEFDQVYDVDDGRPNIPGDLALLIIGTARELLKKVPA